MVPASPGRGSHTASGMQNQKLSTMYNEFRKQQAEMKKKKKNYRFLFFFFLGGLPLA